MLHSSSFPHHIRLFSSLHYHRHVCHCFPIIIFQYIHFCSYFRENPLILTNILYMSSCYISLFLSHITLQPNSISYRAVPFVVCLLRRAVSDVRWKATEGNSNWSQHNFFRHVRESSNCQVGLPSVLRTLGTCGSTGTITADNI